MKRAVTIFIILLNLQFGFSQTAHNLHYDQKGNEVLLGKIDKTDLTKNTFNKWFSENYDDYLENKKVLKRIKDSLASYEVKAFLGTWCGDSQREIPRFYKIIDQIKFPKAQLEIIALNNTEEAYKQGPDHEEAGLNIHRVPTFIFYKNGKEVNRIVESPRESLELDILKIVTGKEYTPNYVVVNYLNNLFNKKSIKELTLDIPNLAPKVSEFVKGSRELNTYGYTLLRSNQMEKAVFIFKLNTAIFPYKSNVYDSLGEAYFKMKDYKEALKNYYTVLSINPEDKNAITMIDTIRSKEQ